MVFSGLNRHVSSLWSCVGGLNDTVIRHGGMLDLIQYSQDDVHRRMKSLNSSLNHILKDLQSLSEHDVRGESILRFLLHSEKKIHLLSMSHFTVCKQYEQYEHLGNGSKADCHTFSRSPETHDISALFFRLCAAEQRFDIYLYPPVLHEQVKEGGQ